MDMLFLYTDGSLISLGTWVSNNFNTQIETRWLNTFVQEKTGPKEDKEYMYIIWSQLMSVECMIRLEPSIHCPIIHSLLDETFSKSF